VRLRARLGRRPKTFVFLSWRAGDLRAKLVHLFKSYGCRMPHRVEHDLVLVLEILGALSAHALPAPATNRDGTIEDPAHGEDQDDAEPQRVDHR
jgi:hypothetical protein